MAAQRRHTRALIFCKSGQSTTAPESPRRQREARARYGDPNEAICVGARRAGSIDTRCRTRVTTCAPSNANTVPSQTRPFDHVECFCQRRARASIPPREGHLRPVQRVTAPTAPFAVSGWTDEEIRQWLCNGIAASGCASCLATSQGVVRPERMPRHDRKHNREVFRALPFVRGVSRHQRLEFAVEAGYK